MTWRCPECRTVLADAELVVEPDAVDPIEVVHCDEARMEQVLVPAYAPPGDLALTSLDHLYPTCPLLRRQCGGREPRKLGGVVRLLLGDKVVDEWTSGGVDPLGEGVCGWCRRVWLARTREVVAEQEAKNLVAWPRESGEEG
jgi:hypothetical protein